MLRVVFVLLCMIITAISPALASDKDDAIARVRQAIDAWNKGDTAAVTPHLMPSLVIIDDLAPNHFQGANAVSDWLEAYAADSAKNAITDPSEQLSKPWLGTFCGTRSPPDLMIDADSRGSAP